MPLRGGRIRRLHETIRPFDTWRFYAFFTSADDEMLDTVPARVATSARRITLHLPQAWSWQTAWTALIDPVSDPPPTLAT